MATKEFDLEFKGSVTPTSTTYLKSQALVMDFKTKIHLDETDAAHLDNLKSAFQSEMATRIKDQLTHLNQWLKQKDQIVTGLVKKYEALKKANPFPSTPQEAKAYEQAMKQMEATAKEVQELTQDYTQIVQDWAENAREQQGRVSMVTAVKTARVKTWDQKTWRVRAGQIVKAVLVVAAIALSVAAIVMSAGTTAPIFVGLAAAGAGLAGITSIATFAKAFKDNATIEKKLMANVQKDIETVKNALKPLDLSKNNIAKHITELKNLMKIRLDNIGKYKNEVVKYEGLSKNYKEALSKLGNNADPAEIARRKKGIEEFSAGLTAAQAKIKKLEDDNASAQKFLDELTSLNVDLDKLSGRTANSLAGNLKERYTSLDGWLELGNTVGGLVNSASGIHH